MWWKIRHKLSAHITLWAAKREGPARWGTLEQRRFSRPKISDVMATEVPFLPMMTHFAEKARMICNHGQKKKYHHSVVGVNSRLDTIQAAVLDVKLKYLDEYNAARQKVAEVYDAAFANHPALEIPFRDIKSTHVFHQYTLKINGLDRDHLKQHLADNGIPSMVYYPVPLNRQEAYKRVGNFPITDDLCTRVLSLPMSTELTINQQQKVIETLLNFA